MNEQKPPKNIMVTLGSLFSGSGQKKDKPPGAARPFFNIWTVLMIFFVLTYIQPFIFPSKTQTIPYSQFKRSMADGNVEDLLISPEKIQGTLKETPGGEFVTVRVDDPGL